MLTPFSRLLCFSLRFASDFFFSFRCPKCSGSRESANLDRRGFLTQLMAALSGAPVPPTGKPDHHAAPINLKGQRLKRQRMRMSCKHGMLSPSLSLHLVTISHPTLVCLLLFLVNVCRAVSRNHRARWTGRGEPLCSRSQLLRPASMHSHLFPTLFVLLLHAHCCLCSLCSGADDERVEGNPAAVLPSHCSTATQTRGKVSRTHAAMQTEQLHCSCKHVYQFEARTHFSAFDREDIRESDRARSQA